MARRLAALNAQWEVAREETEWEEDPWEPHTRIRGAVVVPAEETTPTASPHPETRDSLGASAARVVAPPVPTPVSVPVPGRHAARRPVPRPTWLTRIPVERVGLRAHHLVWVGLVAASALALSAWWVVQAREVAVVAPVSAPVATEGATELVTLPPTGGSTAGATPPDGAAAAGEVVVDVAGKVRRPGIVVLPVGSRVVDALEAAGGARRGVDLQPLNLARLLVDGEQIVVGAAAPAPPAGAVAGAGPTGSAPAGLVNLNTATPAELEALPGVGPVTAAAIVEWRTRHGGFTSVEDLLEVHGIGEVTLERLAALVTV